MLVTFHKIKIIQIEYSVRKSLPYRLDRTSTQEVISSMLLLKLDIMLNFMTGLTFSLVFRTQSLCYGSKHQNNFQRQKSEKF